MWPGTCEPLDVGTQTMLQEMHEALDIDTQIVWHGTHEVLDASIILCSGEHMKPLAYIRFELFNEHRILDVSQGECLNDKNLNQGSHSKTRY